MSTLARRAMVALTLSAVLALLAGCSADGGGSVQSDRSAAHAGGSAPEQAAAPDDAPDAAVVVTGRMTLEADDPITAADKATALVKDAGGRVDGRNEHAASGDATARAELVLRIPSAALDDTLRAVRKLGTLQESSMETKKVDAAQRDLDARISALRTSIARYGEWLAGATKTEDLIELEKSLSDRQSQLESLEAEQRSLSDQVAMATITAAFEAQYVPAPTTPRDLGEAIAAGWNGFLAFWAGVGIALGMGLPWLVLIALVAAAIIWLVRRSHSRRPGPLPAPTLPPDFGGELLGARTGSDGAGAEAPQTAPPQSE
jgi:hypothetical protein